MLWWLLPSRGIEYYYIYDDYYLAVELSIIILFMMVIT